MSKTKNRREAIALMYDTRFELFVRFAFEQVFPLEKLVDSAHIDIVCHALTKVLEGHDRKLIVNLPPRTLKSFIAIVAFSIHLVRRQPRTRLLILAGTQELASDHLKLIVGLLESEGYRATLGPHQYRREGSVLTFESGGSIAVSVYGRKIIGRGFDVCLVDDPQGPADSKSPRLREECNAYFDQSVRPRMNKSGEGRVVVVQQRLHADDLTGHLIEQPGWRQGGFRTLQEQFPCAPSRDFLTT